ncbi:MAG: radical SAM-associated putative lipoprotein [Bacteroidales bacterium]|nr:radical SAM-associated putative lipoprotein [Bacteroidales bacterium]MCF8338573.1 radical SAM-associated putative lipoprotein [Bacteroidales bacterium]
MKKARTKILNSYNLVLGALLSALGFLSSCQEITGPEPKAEYGVPYATFKVNGKIQSSQTNEPIPNIRVIMRYDTTYSNAQGRYETEAQAFPESQEFSIRFRDVDSTQHGSYATKDTTVKFTNPDFSGSSGNWNGGETSKEFNIKLDPEK